VEEGMNDVERVLPQEGTKATPKSARLKIGNLQRIATKQCRGRGIRQGAGLGEVDELQSYEVIV
jgi:hypothetical protein